MQFKFLICLVLLVSGVFSIETLQVTQDNTPIYKSSSSDSENGKLNKGESIFLLKKGADRSFIKTTSDVKGWIKNSNTEYIKSRKGDAYNLDNQDITGWLDNPSAVYILDNSALNSDALPLTRSFEEQVFERMDREEIERGNDEN